ncbi:MAG: DEAD/DEAH box helicase [Leptothrix sp. (in: b-proteobacteria)]
MPFASLGLAPALVRAASERHYLAPTPIQAEAIPAILQGRDVLGSAQTGSGKTAAFALPLLQRLVSQGRETPRRLGALVLVPTRELAVQVGETLLALARHLPQPLKIAAVFGGVSINPQMMNLRGGADLVVATPGRLLDLIEHNALRLSDVQMLVLDEADRLFDLGFAEEIGRILALLPQRRQNLLFSATFPPVVRTLAEQLLSDPVRIDVAAAPVSAPAIVQRAIVVDTARRTLLLRHLLREHGWERLLVFVASRYAAEHVADKLYRAGVEAAALHGELSQGGRSQVLADFKAGRLQVLVATDLAARGIDVSLLPAVLNYDLPRSAVDYTHRIGRTGRAGASGVALSFICADDAGSEAHFRLIEKRQQQRVPREQIAGFEPAQSPAPDAQQPTGGIKGKRKSKKDKLREAAARQG